MKSLSAPIAPKPRLNLTASELSCLLRAARREINRAQDESRRLEDLALHGVVGASAAKDLLEMELNCIARAVRKLWLIHGR